MLQNVGDGTMIAYHLALSLLLRATAGETHMLLVAQRKTSETWQTTIRVQSWQVLTLFQRIRSRSWLACYRGWTTACNALTIIPYTCTIIYHNLLKVQSVLDLPPLKPSLLEEGIATLDYTHTQSLP